MNVISFTATRHNRLGRIHMLKVLLPLALITAAGTAQAENLLDKATGAVSKGLDAVGKTIESTSELVQNEETPE